MYQSEAAALDTFSTALAEANRSPLAELRERQQAQQRLMRQLDLSDRARFLVALTQEVIWQKGYRKDVEYHAFWCYESLLRELAKRVRTDDWRALFFLLPWELVDWIRTGQPSLSELPARREYSCLRVNRSAVELLTGEAARTFARSLQLGAAQSDATELRGQCAVAGDVTGTVKLVFVPADMVKVNPGDILVSQATSPDLLPAMKKAGAIVTNVGGLICHAAITARELQIPCVVGTVRATQVLQDGDRVRVNATAGTVSKL